MYPTSTKETEMTTPKLRTELTGHDEQAARFGDAEYVRLVAAGWDRDDAAKAAAKAERDKLAELNASKS